MLLPSDCLLLGTAYKCTCLLTAIQPCSIISKLPPDFRPLDLSDRQLLKKFLFVKWCYSTAQYEYVWQCWLEIPL